MKLKLIIKRLIDILCSLFGLILLSPILIIVSILVYFKLGSPIFFIQKRIGKDNKEFKMIKFRSMKNAKNEFGEDLPDEERLTSFGKKLRSLSIDELPELLNVLKGDMSLVGPRPLLVEYLKLYSDEQIRRHEMRPGITGLAQVNGRSLLDVDKRAQYDIYYSENVSLMLDIKIVLSTIKVVFRGIGVNSSLTKEKSK